MPDALPDQSDRAWREARADDYLEPLAGMIRSGKLAPPDEMVLEDPPICYLGHVDCYDMHWAERRADEADWEQEREMGL